MGAGSWDAQLIVVRSEWRRRWRPYLVLAIVAGVAAGAVVATLLAAGRSDGAFRRLRSATHAADLSVFVPEQSNPSTALEAIERIDGVRAAAREAELFVRPVGSGLFPDYDLYARAPSASARADAVNVPVVIAGRRADPRQPDEVMLSERLAGALGVGVGDTITLESMTSEWVDRAFNGDDPGPPDGPTSEARVVGLSRTPADFARWKGLIHLTPAFDRRYRGMINEYSRIEVGLDDGASPRAVNAALRQLDRGVDVGPALFADDQATDDGLATIAVALRIVAAIAAIAATIVVSLAIVRITRLAATDRQTLVVLGWTRGQLSTLSVLAVAPWLAGGVAVGLFVGLAVSPEILVGLAGRVDPAPGAIVVDSLVLVAVGSAALVVGVLVAAMTGRRSATRPNASAARLNPILALRRPVPAVLGIRQALGGEATRGGRASWGAVGVTCAAVAIAVAALVVSASISHLLIDPSLSGGSAYRVVDAGESLDAYRRALPVLERDRRVATLAGVHVVFGIRADRGGELTALVPDFIRGRLGLSTVEGRGPRGPDEVGLGPATLDRLGKRVGDRVRLRADRLSASYRIVGSTLFPEGDFEHDNGVALTAAGAQRLIRNVQKKSTLHQVVFDWAADVDASRADDSLEAFGLHVLTSANALEPTSVTNLGQVEDVPRFLAAFLALLALTTVGYALWATVRGRTSELGTLRALGMTRPSSVGIVAIQAVTIIGIGLLVGVPLGILLGARVWRPIADGANVVVRSIAPSGDIATFVAAVAIVTVVIVSLPAWRVFRMRAADTLRAE